VFVVVQAASAVVYDRPDWDDVYYLAAVLDYQHAEAINSEEPTHRAGFPVYPHNILISWELWGAVLCHLSGLNPMAVFHTLLPGVLVLLVYAAYWQVLAEYVPRRWVPWALLGLAAYHVWGIASHHTAANYLLPRTWQGKTVFMHLAVPLIVVTLTRYVRQPQWSAWLSLVASVVFGLAASSSAVFLEPMLLSCLALALVMTVPRRNWLPGLAGAAAAALPPVAYGLLIRQAIVSDPVLAPEPESDWTLWFRYLGTYTAKGSWEGLWLLLLPWLWVLLRSRQRAAYLVLFPLVFTLTFNNPLLCDPVAKHLTSPWTFPRVFWLLPVGMGLGTFLALLGRLLGRALRSGLPLPTELLAGALILAGCAGSWFLPGIYVWDANHNNMIGPGGAPKLAQNLLKMPRDLIPLAEALRRDPEILQVNILCDDSIANYLTPYSRAFRLVHPRIMYTLPFAARAGRLAEGEKRYLVSLLLDAIVPGKIAPEDLFVRTYFGDLYFPNPPKELSRERVEQMLDELRVKYVVLRVNPNEVSPEFLRRVEAKLREVGYHQEMVNAGFALWTRALRPGSP
jgi:hypothetical protein